MIVRELYRALNNSTIVLYSRYGRATRLTGLRQIRVSRETTTFPDDVSFIEQCRRIQRCVSTCARTRRGFLKSRRGDTHRRYARLLSRREGSERRATGDTFICGLLMHEQPGLISLQRDRELRGRGERSQADGKMFLFSPLKLFIKGSLLHRGTRRGYDRVEAEGTRVAATREKEIVVS